MIESIWYSSLHHQSQWRINETIMQFSPIGSFAGCLSTRFGLLGRMRRARGAARSAKRRRQPKLTRESFYRHGGAGGQPDTANSSLLRQSGRGQTASQSSRPETVLDARRRQGLSVRGGESGGLRAATLLLLLRHRLPAQELARLFRDGSQRRLSALPQGGSPCSQAA